jgi:hypothetical protein
MAIIRDLIARPSQLSPLARIAIDAFAARSEMLRVRRLLGPHFGLEHSPRVEATEPVEAFV